MTNEEALKILKADRCIDCAYGNMYCCDTVLECANEKCEYRQAIMIAMEALKKQIPIEPKDRIHYEYIGDVGKCPYCGADINQTMNYCPTCGQAIKREDEE